jgi:hypothetical protein
MVGYKLQIENIDLSRTKVECNQSEFTTSVRNINKYYVGKTIM